ncbi:MAG: hypothetical protein ACOH17_08540 [Cellulomonas sp.]
MTSPIDPTALVSSIDPNEPSKPAPALVVQLVAHRVVDDSPLIPDRSADDSDTGWHEGPDSNDERLLRDVPPHW